MKLTKYEHACVVLEEQGQKLLIDPGTFTKSLQDIQDITVLVLTHEHADHYDPALVARVMQVNPEIRVFAPEDLAAKLADSRVAVIRGGDQDAVGPFMFSFHGNEHAPIHQRLTPMPANVGVMINELVFYPGDAFTLPGKPVTVLLTPISGPWLKVGEIIQYLEATKPLQAIPTHEALLSPIGHELTDQNWLAGVCAEHAITYTRLSPGQSIEIQ